MRKKSDESKKETGTDTGGHLIREGATETERALEEARELLAEVTPLKRDCGRLCGARCCASMEGDETGMRLFPGEEEIYAGMPGWKLLAAEGGTIAVCPGSCERKERPLACRMFPLLPEPAEDGSVRARTDLRARAVCPLSRQGLSGMDPAFTEAVQRAGEILMSSPGQAEELRHLAEEQRQIREIRRRWKGEEHV